jgi:hypothetical protein
MKQQFKIIIIIIIIIRHELGPDRPVAASVLKYMSNFIKPFMFYHLYNQAWRVLTKNGVMPKHVVVK